MRTPDRGSPRLPSEAGFREMAAAHAEAAPHPEHFQDVLAKCSAAAPADLGWAADVLRALTAPTLPVIGDSDFVRVEHAAELQRLIADSRLAVLPAATHMSVVRQPELPPMLGRFLASAS